jgi:predicted branched-subunit amino acid permease
LTTPATARVVRDALAIGLAVGAYALGFGAAAVTAGLSQLQACVLSLLVFSGASQFALIGVLGSGGSALAGVAGALLIGSRNTLYGVRLASLLSVDWPKRFVAAQLTVDETTAMATAAPPQLRGPAFWITATVVYASWNLGTLLGAVGAGVVNTKSLGLDAAVGAAFLALLAPQVRNITGLWVAAAGALLAVAAIPFTPAGVPILIAGLAVLPAVARR